MRLIDDSLLSKFCCMLLLDGRIHIKRAIALREKKEMLADDVGWKIIHFEDACCWIDEEE